MNLTVKIYGLDFVYSVFSSLVLSDISVIGVFYYFLTPTHIHIQIQRQTYTDKQAYTYDNKPFSLRSKWPSQFLNPMSEI